MSSRTEIGPQFSQALENQDWSRVEELWLEALDCKPIPADELFAVRHALWQAGRKGLARTLLELLAEALEAADDPDHAVTALRDLVRLGDGRPSEELLDRLVDALARARRDKPSLAQVLDRLAIPRARRPLDALEAAERWLDHDRGTIVEVVGQGVGPVVELNLQLENIKVDLGGRKPVSVPFGAAERYLRPLPEGDFRRRKVEAPTELAAFIEQEPGESLVQILESLGEGSDVAAIKAALDGLLPAQKWTSWWGKARKHPRIVTSGTGSRLRYGVTGSAAAADASLLDELRDAPPANRPILARRLAERGSEAAASAAAILLESLPKLENSDPGLAWLTAGVLAGLPDGSEAASRCRQRLLDRGGYLGLLGGISDRTARDEALEAIVETAEGRWPEVWADWLLHEESTQNLSKIARRLNDSGHEGILDQAVEAIFRNHTGHPAQFIWACEIMTEDGCPEVIRSRMTPSLLEKMPDALTKKEFSAFRARAKGLLDGGRAAIRILTESASAQQAERFSQRLSRIEAVEPQRVRLVEQAAASRQSASTEESAPVFVATRAAVERKRDELRSLLEEEIPKTLKGINAAAAEGDLRENFEYHMLRDRQELLSARAAKIQEELGAVRILEPGAADVSTVNIGTVVHFDEVDGSSVPPITILGAWDADLDRRIFANGSELAQRLLGCSVGDKVEIEEGTATIDRIEAWRAEAL